MPEITGGGPLDPKDKKMYEQEYRHGADLFQRALGQYTKAENPYQQEEFKDVMDQALQVMNETAGSLMRQELQKQNDKITKDYNTFQQFPDDPDTLEKLKKDLEQAKKSVPPHK